MPRFQYPKVGKHRANVTTSVTTAFGRMPDHTNPATVYACDFPELMKKIMTRDRLYRSAITHIPPFEFNQEVVGVFDDMIRRSVPGYDTIITTQVQIIHHFYQPNTRIFDLGCSHGNLGLRLIRRFPELKFCMIAADNSPAMLTAMAERLSGPNDRQQIHLCCCDISDLRLHQASVVVINFTLQFLPLHRREQLIREVYKALVPGGILLFSEKVVHTDRSLNRLQKEFHYRFKRDNGYSELEISQKREALEDVLIPETVEVHSNRLNQIGFRQRDIWFKCFNFCSWICIK